MHAIMLYKCYKRLFFIVFWALNSLLMMRFLKKKRSYYSFYLSLLRNVFFQYEPEPLGRYPKQHYNWQRLLYDLLFKFTSQLNSKSSFVGCENVTWNYIMNHEKKMPKNFIEKSVFLKNTFAKLKKMSLVWTKNTVQNFKLY